MPTRSEWRVSTNWVLNRKVYQVYRLRDRDKAMESGNMDIVSNWDNKADAEAAAKRLNVQDAERYWEAKLP